jgi:hypothetical protein
VKAPNLAITPELLQALGIDPATIRDQVVEAIVARAMGKYHATDDDGWDTGYVNATELSKHVHAHIDKIAAARFAEMIGPVAAEVIENATFPETNRYGEPKGPTLTLKEKLNERARLYLAEEVDSNGRAAWEGGDLSYNRPKTPRIVHLIREHFRYTMQTAIEQLMKEANQQIAGGIEKAVSNTLASILQNLKITTKVDA